MTLTALKLTLSRIWIFVKNYWHIPFVLLTLLISWLVFRSNNEKMIELLNRTRENYKKEIDILKDAHKKEMQIRDEMFDQYNKIIDELEKQYKDKQEELDEKKKEEIKDLVEKYKNDNETLAKKISEKFGVNYVPN